MERTGVNGERRDDEQERNLPGPTCSGMADVPGGDEEDDE